MSKNCPNNCVDGFYIDPYIHKRIECPYCRNKRLEESATDELKESLNLPDNYTNAVFEPEAVIPLYSRKLMVESSVTDVIKVMKDLVTGVAGGSVPSHSMLFNLGIKVVEANFLAPLILKGYIAGLKVQPVIEVPYLMSERVKYENNEESKFPDILNCDLCVVTMDAGTDYKGIMAVKGLMQLRARREKATIVLTSVWNNTVLNMCCEDEDNGSLKELATLYSVQYIEKEKPKQSNRSNGIGTSSKDFNDMLRNRDIL